MKTVWIALVFACITGTTSVQAQALDLFAAARADDVNGAQALLANHADINQQDAKGYTPLIVATYNGNYEVARFLLEHGAATEKKDASGRTALMGVCFKGDDRDVELLLEHGADVNAKDAKGMTSMMYAVMFGRISVIKALHASEAAKTAASQVSSTR